MSNLTMTDEEVEALNEWVEEGMVLSAISDVLTSLDGFDDQQLLQELVDYLDGMIDERTLDVYH